MVEGNSLENCQARKGLVGSNPTLSARRYRIRVFSDFLLSVVWYLLPKLIYRDSSGTSAQKLLIQIV